MASVNTAVGNVLDTLVSSSNAVCTAINTVGKSAQFGSNWMDSVLAKQRVSLKIDAAIFESTYVETRAVELATARQSIEEWADTNPRTKALYEVSLAQLKAVLEPATAATA